MKGKFCFGEFQLLPKIQKPWSHQSISFYLESNLSSSFISEFDVDLNQNHKSEHSWTLGLFELQSGYAFANVLYLYNTSQAKSPIWVLSTWGGSARKFCNVSSNLISSHWCILLFGSLSVYLPRKLVLNVRSSVFCRGIGRKGLWTTANFEKCN